jgi:hypothetical protein
VIAAPLEELVLPDELAPELLDALDVLEELDALEALEEVEELELLEDLPPSPLVAPPP